jgi:two-component system response regulator AlgR
MTRSSDEKSPPAIADSSPLRLLIVDDEPLARLRLRSLLDEPGGIASDVVGEAADAEQALHALRTVVADAVLLDIRMPGRDGLRLAHTLRLMESPPEVIFVTAHADHALRAFELEAIDYLTKPVRRERLQQALARVLQRRPAPALSTSATARWVDSSARVEMILPPTPGVVDGPVLVVSDRGRMLRLPLVEVLYLRAEQKSVSLRTVQQTHVLDDALADLEQRLGSHVIRIHRNALVARHAVRELALRPETDAAGDIGDGWAVRVAPTGEWLAVSRRQLALVRAALEGGGRSG